MSVEDITEVSGVWRSPNLLSETPAGAFARLENCIIRSKGVIEPRPALQTLVAFGQRQPKAVGIAYAAFSTASAIPIAHVGTDVAVGNITIQSNVSAPDEAIKRMAFATAAERCYYTTSNGVQRYDLASRVPAGGLRSTVSWTDSHAVAAANGPAVVNSAARFASLLVTVDARQREIVSAVYGSAVVLNPPAQTAIIGAVVRTGGNLVTVTTPTAHNFKVGDAVTLSPGEANFPAGTYVITSVPSALSFIYVDVGANTSSANAQTFQIGSAAYSVRVMLPDGATTSTIVRLFRSEVTASASILPSEDVRLVYEGKLDATDITNGYVTISDATPDVVLGPIAYFSPSAETLTANNAVPPLASDLALFGNVLFYGRTREPHALTLRLLATGGSSGVTGGTTLTITRGSSSLTYTAGTNYVVYSGGSVALDNERTALGLVDIINLDGANTFVDAQYISGTDDAPGIIRLTARDFGTTAFTVSCSRPLAFNPALQASAPASSTQLDAKARVYWAKPDLPDAVPPLNYADIGDTNEAVLRVIELRERLYVIKENSVWTVSGTYGRYVFDRLDDTLSPVGADTFVVAAGQILGLATQGVVAISDTGIGLVGLPIQDEIEPLLAVGGSIPPIYTTRRVAWGASCETDHIYLLGLPLGQYDTTANVIWCYSTLAKAWMRWPGASSCGVNDPVLDSILMGDPVRNELRLAKYGERAFDETFNTTIFSVVASPEYTDLGFADASSISVGDVIFGTASAISATGIAVAKTGNTVRVIGGGPWAPGAATVGVAFECVVESAPAFMSAPAVDKLLQEIQLLFKRANYRTMEVSVASDMSPQYRVTRIISVRGWGEAAWGEFPWGQPSGPRNERLLAPQGSNRGQYFSVRLRIREATRWKLQGLSLQFDANDTKGRR